MMPEEPKGEVSYDAMLPELRAGLRHAAKRRARQEFPGVRSWEAMLVILLFGGASLWFAAELSLLRTFGCAAAVLAFGAILAQGWWWNRQMKRCMREVLLDAANGVGRGLGPVGVGRNGAHRLDGHRAPVEVGEAGTNEAGVQGSHILPP